MKVVQDFLIIYGIKVKYNKSEKQSVMNETDCFFALAVVMRLHNKNKMCYTIVVYRQKSS